MSRQLRNPETGTVSPNLTKYLPPSPCLTLQTFPPEIRLMIFSTCIKSTRTSNKGDRLPTWFLSHRLPQSLLFLSKQIRDEALSALATHPGLRVNCYIWADVFTPRRYAEDLDLNPDQVFHFHQLRTERRVMGPLNAAHCKKDFYRVRDQCRQLNVPKGMSLTIKFCDDGKSTQDHLLIELVAMRRTLVDAAFLAAEEWPQWRHVNIDVAAMNDAMRMRLNYYPILPNHELDGQVDMSWKAMMEDLQPLRAITKTLRISLQGWRQDSVLETLNKGEITPDVED